MKYLKVFTDFLDVIDALSDGAVGRLFRAMLRYALDGTEPALKGREAVLWTVARQSIDREKKAYEGMVEARREAGRRGADARWQKLATHDKNGQDKDKDKNKNNDNNNDNDSLSSAEVRLTAEEREKKPSLEEVIAFSREAGLNADVQYFYNYYEANGWYIGKRPIRDWKAALRAWARKTPLPRPAPVKGRGYSDSFREALELACLEEAKEK